MSTKALVTYPDLNASSLNATNEAEGDHQETGSTECLSPIEQRSAVPVQEVRRWSRVRRLWNTAITSVLTSLRLTRQQAEESAPPVELQLKCTPREDEQMVPKKPPKMSIARDKMLLGRADFRRYMFGNVCYMIRPIRSHDVAIKDEEHCVKYNHSLRPWAAGNRPNQNGKSMPYESGPNPRQTAEQFWTEMVRSRSSEEFMENFRSRSMRVEFEVAPKVFTPEAVFEYFDTRQPVTLNQFWDFLQPKARVADIRCSERKQVWSEDGCVLVMKGVVTLVHFANRLEENEFELVFQRNQFRWFEWQITRVVYGVMKEQAREHYDVNDLRRVYKSHGIRGARPYQNENFRA
eukprot:scpid4763/ scgid25126/ 